MMNKIEIDLDKIPNGLGVLDVIYLYYKHNGLDTSMKEDLHQIEQRLENEKYLKITDGGLILREKGIELVEKSGIIKEVGSNLPEDLSWIEEYRKIFKDTGPGKASDIRTLTKKMQWFINSYPEFADKNLILKASRRYVDLESLKGYTYLQRADYFISKEDTSKIKVSRLAAFCEEILDEGHFEEENTLL